MKKSPQRPVVLWIPLLGNANHESLLLVLIAYENGRKKKRERGEQNQTTKSVDTHFTEDENSFLLLLARHEFIAD